MIRPFITLSLALAVLGRAWALPPKINGFTPTKGAPGTQVTISGANFDLSATVYFTGVNSTASAQILGVTAGSLQVLVPADATTGPISISTTGGSATSKSYFQPSPLISYFFIPNKTQFDGSGKPIPPIRANAGDPLTVIGHNFNDSPNFTYLTIGGVLYSVVPAGDGQINAPAIPQAAAQSGPIVVTTSAGSVTNGMLYFNPVVTGFTTPAPVGATVNIFGFSLLGVTDVRFGSVPAQFAVLAGTNLQAVVPAGALNAPLTVISPGGSFITSSNFLVAPTLASFTPAGGPAGTVVTLTGTALSNTTGVLFGSVAAKTLTNLNPTTVTAVVPPGSFTAPITLTTANGSGTSTTPFYVAPTIGGISPFSGQVGAIVTLTGQNFTGVSQVTLAGQNVPIFTVAATNKLTLTVPAGAVSGVFQVTTPGGTAQSADTFTVLGVLPAVTGFNPAGGPAGTLVTISGANLTSATNVDFNGTVASFTVSDGNLLATVPAAATTGPIRVTTPAGQSTSAASFVVGSSADLKVTLLPSTAKAIAYASLSYGIQLANRGPLPAANVQVTLTLPAGVTFDSVTGFQNYDVLGRNVVFHVGALAVNDGSFSPTVRVRVGAPGTLSAVLSATSDTPDTTPANNTTTVSVTAILPPLALESLGDSTLYLQWPSLATNYVLETAPSLASPPAWTTVTNAPADDTVNKSLLLSTDPATAFYRLRLNQ